MKSRGAGVGYFWPMDSDAFKKGLNYELLMKRAYQLNTPAMELGADRRIYDQLHYIEKGYDLRGIGYHNQLSVVRNHAQNALKQFLKKGIDKDRKILLRFLQIKLKAAITEADIAEVIQQVLTHTENIR